MFIRIGLMHVQLVSAGCGGGQEMIRMFNGMRGDGMPGATWIKSSYSGAQGNCVELAKMPTGDVAMRNSRDPDGPVLIYTRDEVDAFLAGAKHGEFDAFVDDEFPSASVLDDPAAANVVDSPDVTSRYREIAAGLRELTDTLSAGETTLDRHSAEQLLRVLGAVSLLHRMHRVDSHGRCGICRTKLRLRWNVSARQYDVCSVLAALSLYAGASPAMASERPAHTSAQRGTLPLV